jgi:hypothetical protein
MVKILLFVASVDERSGHTFGGTTVVGGCKPIAFPQLAIWRQHNLLYA